MPALVVSYSLAHHYAAQKFVVNALPQSHTVAKNTSLLMIQVTTITSQTVDVQQIVVRTTQDADITIMMIITNARLRYVWPPIVVIYDYQIVQNPALFLKR